VSTVDPVNILEFEDLARARMERASFDYYAGGAEDERTLAANRLGFERLAFRPRVLVNTDHIDTAIDLLGERLAFPVVLAPTALNRVGHPDGELAVARAAGAAGTLFCTSTVASFTLEEVAAASTGPRWFQLYMYRDRGVTENLVRRAEASGYRAIVLTVDTPRLGRRERDVRHRFALPQGVRMRNLEVSVPANVDWGGATTFGDFIHRLLDGSLTWESLTWLKGLTTLPVLIKGILTAEDAALALDHGASGVIVSNHGGRQLDGAVATIDALPEIVDKIGGRIPILMDGGIRRGTDVLKALALGAAAVAIGRPYLWGLAAAGEAGVARVLEMLRSELELAMALSGAPSVGAISRALVTRRE
jgi:isopentenyl diphosphate isomerase/L-lactate dehydrogenase-like FMN-dependent dehydrogenase